MSMARGHPPVWRCTYLVYAPMWCPSRYARCRYGVRRSGVGLLITVDPGLCDAAGLLLIMVDPSR